MTPEDIPFSFGGIARPNPDNLYDNDALEDTPHGPVHVYVGGSKTINGHQVPGDMSVFPTAARDPIFFAHHGNLDRLWETWRTEQSSPQGYRAHVGRVPQAQVRVHLG